ncbi:MAG TPA: hypothetical protein VHF25_16120 [Nitriliruptorales bacterium]|nr:hypothetical protein [Nitriliruptorales bacterium]
MGPGNVVSDLAASPPPITSADAPCPPVAALRGDPTDPRSAISDSLALYGEQINAVIITGYLRFVAIVGNQLGQHERAARLAGAQAAWQSKLGGQAPTPSSPTRIQATRPPDSSAGKPYSAPGLRGRR